MNKLEYEVEKKRLWKEYHADMLELDRLKAKENVTPEEIDAFRARVNQKFGAILQTEKSSVPSFVEDVLRKILPQPAATEMYIGAHPGDAVVEAVFERKKIIQEALASDNRTSEPMVSAIANAMFNDGFTVSQLESLAAGMPTPETLKEIQHIFEAVGIPNTFQKVHVTAVIAVARTILKHVHTYHSGAVKTYEVKTPFIAWRTKENILELINNDEMPLVQVRTNGYDSRRQMEEFNANFVVTDIVLWDHEIWKAATRGSESFEGTPLTADLVDSVTPMFWQYNRPMALQQSVSDFNLDGINYECIGFVILPWIETLVKVELPEELVNVVGKNPAGKNDDDVLIEIKQVTTQRQREAFAKSIETSTRFSKRGISPLVVFMPTSEPNNGPQIRSLRPILEGDFIGDYALLQVIMAGLKFLTLKYVATETVGVSNKELKKDRALFKKVRHGKVQVPPIKIINLRRAEKRERTSEDEAKAHRYQCHFLVETHWRKQWHPSLKRRIPTRILSYVKGDLTKPFKAPREKVFKAVR